MHAFASYRLAATVNLSARYSYGSGLPLRGFFQGDREALFLSAGRNELRLPEYSRLDVRLNRAFIRDRWQITLFAEFVNMLGRENIRYSDIGSFRATTGRARPGLEPGFPFLPSVGLAVEF